MQDNSIIQRIAEDVMGKKGAPTYPYILCKRNVPPDLTYDLHSVGEWEGLKGVISNGRTAFEIDPNFTLIIKPDGTCFIPDTPNNRERLKRVSSSQKITEYRKRHNSQKMVDEEYMVETIIPAAYEQIEASLLNSSMAKEIARQVREILAQESDEFAEAPEVVSRPHHAMSGAVTTEVVPPAAGPKLRKGKEAPKAVKPKGGDDLMDPVR